MQGALAFYFSSRGTGKFLNHVKSDCIFWNWSDLKVWCIFSVELNYLPLLYCHKHQNSQIPFGVKVTFDHRTIFKSSWKLNALHKFHSRNLDFKHSRVFPKKNCSLISSFQVLIKSCQFQNCFIVLKLQCWCFKKFSKLSDLNKHICSWHFR